MIFFLIYSPLAEYNLYLYFSFIIALFFISPVPLEKMICLLYIFFFNHFSSALISISTYNFHWIGNTISPNYLLYMYIIFCTTFILVYCAFFKRISFFYFISWKLLWESVKCMFLCYIAFSWLSLQFYYWSFHVPLVNKNTEKIKQTLIETNLPSFIKKNSRGHWK